MAQHQSKNMIRKVNDAFKSLGGTCSRYQAEAWISQNRKHVVLTQIQHCVLAPTAIPNTSWHWPHPRIKSVSPLRPDAEVNKTNTASCSRVSRLQSKQSCCWPTEVKRCPSWQRTCYITPGAQSQQLMLNTTPLHCTSGRQSYYQPRVYLCVSERRGQQKEQ